MITQIRKSFKSAAYKSVLWITIFALAGVFSLPTLLRRSVDSGPWAVRVNGEQIGYHEFIREVNEQRDKIAQLRVQYGEYADTLFAAMGVNMNPHVLAIEALAREALLNQTAQAIGIHVHPEYIAQRLLDPYFIMRDLAGLVPPQAIDKSGVNWHMVHNYLQRRGLTIGAFEQIIERKITEQIILQMIATILYIPHFDLILTYIAENVAKKFSIMTLSYDAELKQEKLKQISAEERVAFFDKQNAQSKRYLVPEKRSGILWKFDPKSYDITITEQQVEAYYDDNKAKLFVAKPVTVQVRRILFMVDDEQMRPAVEAKAFTTYQELVKNPSQFASVAQEMSDDKESAKKGGLLPPFTRGEKDETIERTVFLLKEDGAISSVIATSEGYEIFQRVSKTSQTYKPLHSVQSTIKDTLYYREFEKQFVDDMKRIVQASGDEQEQLFNAFITQKGSKPISVTRIVYDDSPLAKELFRLKSKERAFYTKDKQGVALQLTEIQAPYLPSLESIKQVVDNDIYEERAMAALQKKLTKVRQEAAQKPLNQLKEEFNASLIQTGWIKPTDEDEIKKLEKKGVPVRSMLHMEKQGMLFTHSGEQDGYIIQLDELAPLDQEQLRAHEQELRQTLYQERVRSFVGGFVASLYRHAKIETNESLLTIQE